MAPSPDTLSPAGSSTYSSDTMYVGDGTWDSTKNDFLLPNLVGLNYDTMVYNGMGNRFSTMPQYHQLIKAHGIIAAITFLGIVPAAILIARFYAARPGMALRLHIWLQVLTLGLTIVVFILGWFAVGPERSLTNPHHGIGTAIFVLVLFQVLSGWFIHRREKGRMRTRLPLRLMVHSWLGRALALLGIAQVPLGLTLYGSPKFLFILYALWMSFLLLLYFILCYRAQIPLTAVDYESHRSNTVISDRRPSRMGGLGAPLAAGLGLAALTKLGRGKSRSRSRSRRDSRRGSGSYFEEEKHAEHRRESGGLMNKVMKGAAVVGAGALAKSWWDRRQRRRHDDDDYSSVSTDTPTRDRRRHRPDHSELTEDYTEVSRAERARPTGPLLPGPGATTNAAAAISAAEGGPRPTPVTPTRPRTPRSRRHRDSLDSDYSSYYESPSRRKDESHGARNAILAGLGAGWIAKKWKDRQERNRLRKEDEERAEIEEERRREEERRAGRRGSRLTGDGTPTRRQKKLEKHSQLTSLSSDLSSDLTESHVEPAGGPMPPLPAGVMPGSALATESTHMRSKHDDITAPVSMPPAPPDPAGILYRDSGSESYVSGGGHPHRRHSSRTRHEAEAAAAAGAAALAAEEAEHHHRAETSTQAHSPAPVSLKLHMHGDKNQNVTFRRLNDEEAAADREARRQRRRRGESTSSLSSSDVAASRRRYRREEQRRAEAALEQPAGPSSAPPPAMTPLTPPNPAFAAGRRPAKDSAYFSGQPAGSHLHLGPSSVGTDSHGTWSGMSPVSGDEESAAERRRRRRLERQQRPTGTVDFT